jgi:hypothetical protein
MERPHRDRLMSDKALGEYLRVPPAELAEILESKPGLVPVIETRRGSYYRSSDIFRWLDRLHVQQVA